MSIEQFSRIGIVVFLDPDLIRQLGYPCDIENSHPFVVLDTRKTSGCDECLVVPLTSKGSRRTSIPVPAEHRRGTRKFRQTDCHIYSDRYDHWIPATVLLDARVGGPWVLHDGNAIDPAFVARILPRMSSVRSASWKALWQRPAILEGSDPDMPSDSGS